MTRLKNSWICQKEQSVFKTPIVELFRRECQSSEDERRHSFYVMRTLDWCNIIPVTEGGKVVLVKQHRVGTDQMTHEIPGGSLDPSDESVIAAALREMTEETGYVPLPGSKHTVLGKMATNPALFNNYCHSLIVGPVRKMKAPELDHGEMIETLEVSLDEIFEMIWTGKIDHALMLNTFFFLLLKHPDSKENLKNSLKEYSHPNP